LNLRSEKQDEIILECFLVKNGKCKNKGKRAFEEEKILILEFQKNI